MGVLDTTPGMGGRAPWQHRSQRRARIGLLIGLPLLACLGCKGHPEDEAMQAGWTVEQLPSSENDYLQDMDYGITKNPAAVVAALEPFFPGIKPDEAVKAVVRGRNNWVIWSAGNDRLWDQLSKQYLGTLDLLKTISNHRRIGYSRDNRWYYLGLVNEPCFKKGTGPRADRFGLWLDVRDPACGPEPFEDETKYPGVKLGARGRDGFPVGSYYGYATGVVGLRLFPNPEFDEKAQAAWDPVRYYEDETYYKNKDLVKPYRVGMSCGFCHVGPNPSNPPPDPENPEWRHLNSNPGAQYFWFDRVFYWDWPQQERIIAEQTEPPTERVNYVYEMLHLNRPGALDTSLVSSDNISNPRTMNAVYSLPARLEIAKKWGREKLVGGQRNNKQFNDYAPPLPADSALLAFYQDPDTVWTPRVLKDGADSVGALGALNRVYINIGLYSEEWTKHFIPLVGKVGGQIKPMEIEVAQENSVYWKANEAQTPDLALFFIASARPDWLADAPGGDAYLQEPEETVTRGKEVFAERCARCHSSKLPPSVFENFFPNEGCVGPGYLQCWDDYWAHTKTEGFKREMKQLALAPDFLDNNFLSTELRVPVTLLETNACSPLATNAIEGDIWNDFSSDSYKSLPSVGSITVHDPRTGAPRPYLMPAGGRGYTRPASLISLWSTAPYLLNNAVGEFKWSGSVPDRMASFEDGIRQLLWPETRTAGDPQYGAVSFVTKSGKMAPGLIDRTRAMSALSVPKGYLGPIGKVTGDLELGHFPKGTPVALIANVDFQHVKPLLELVPKLVKAFKNMPKNPTNDQARKELQDLFDPLLAVSKCPDYVVNRGHYFGTDYLPGAEGEPGLSDDDKEALIAFLKRL